ncbi:MAG TPA: Uma2 family endonuclease [Candidatus Rifleibacterium sp.]|nr:Uma2 family endonuclease [Candidatus Rifleibacterium sp.]HPT45340.1 Uma2 family endonuclease [Candidatus Rifleibacterium sp.]
MPLAEKKCKRDFFTWADYITWPENERWEIINGEAFDMSPAPGVMHQEVSTALSGLLYNFFSEHTCRLFHAPFDVKLPENDEAIEETSTIVQPDIVVYCDPEKLDEHGGTGAPDLAVEILSPSSSKRDLIDKMALYERHGVREYWVVDTFNKVISIWNLEKDGKFGREQTFRREDQLKSTIFPELNISLEKVFPEASRKNKPSPAAKR